MNLIHSGWTAYAPLAAIVIHHMQGPHIDWAAISPLVAMTIGAVAVLLLGLLRGTVIRERIVPVVTLVALAATIATEIWRFPHPARTVVAGALRIDDLALVIDLICAAAAVATVFLSWRAHAAHEAGHGEYHGLMLFSLLGMGILVSATDLVTLFIGIELLSIPLYVLCAAEYRREGSLESGLKYLVIGSVGSATLVYGLAMVYGATGATQFGPISTAIAQGTLSGGIAGDPLLLTGIGLVTVGFAFKASIAPFHQWTPDVYEGAPTPVTAFMATATKAAALGIFLRFFDVAVIGAQDTWAPLLAALATITIIVGNVGALTQTSMKRMLGYSGVGQAGYMLCGVIVGTKLGASATVLYLAAYLMMNIAAFAVVIAVERDRGDDQLSSLAGLGARSPWLAWPLTIAMLGLAGVPGTVGFIGKFQLIHALVDGDYTWLAIVLVVGAMISLGYYLRVVATVWMGERSMITLRPRGVTFRPIAGGSPEADEAGVDGAGIGPDRAVPHPEVALVAVVFGAATVFFGIFPQPLFELANHAGAALAGLF
jgi:NADH-quinone oxidoreductase subunit N